MQPSPRFSQDDFTPRRRETIDGYEVIESVGRGTQADALRVRDAEGSDLILKRLNPLLAADRQHRERFRREAEAAMEIDHQNVRRIHTLVRHRTGLMYQLGEYVPGRSLKKAHEEGQPFPPARLLRIATQVAAGLAAFHDAGFRHGDLKPDNIILSPDGRVVLIDPGLAAYLDQPQGSLVGTPLYLAPEQVRNDAIDGRADLYPLGVLLYLLATGRSPYTAGTIPELLREIADRKSDPFTKDLSWAWAAKVPLQMAVVIMRLMAKGPEDRYRSAHALQSELAKIDLLDDVTG